MGRALVIKGANFESNRVAQVIFSGIPCTGVSFSEDTYNVSSMIAGLALAVTKTPADTTDEAVFTVADTSVAKVENGMLYAVGFGTTTVTVTCGSASDTATVTVQNIETEIQKIEHLHIQTVTSWGDSNPIKASASEYYDAYVILKTSGPNVADTIAGESNRYAVQRMPNGTGSIRLKLEGRTAGWNGVIRCTTTNSDVADSGIHYAKFLETITPATGSDTYELTNIPADMDSFAFEIATNTENGTLKITFVPTV